MSDNFNGALSSRPMDQDAITELADTLRRVEQEGRVSKADVLPYIDHFPAHISIDDFDDEATPRNYTVATESMAAFLKIGLAMAVIGAIGYVVYNLVFSRKKCEKISTEEGWRAYLFKEVNEARGVIMNSPCWLNTGMVGGNGLTLSNAIENALNNDPNLSLALETEGKRLFSRSFYGDLPSFSEKSGIVQYGDVLAQGAAINSVHEILKGAAERIQNGNASEVIAELNKALALSPTDRLINALTSNLGGVLPRLGQKLGQSNGNYLLELAEALEGYYEGVEQSSTSVVTELRTNLITLGNGRPAFPVSLTETNLSTLSEACKKAGDQCEKLKGDARNFKLNEEVEKAASPVIEELNSVTKAGGRLIDLAAAETTSSLRHARWIANVHVQILKMAEEILRHNSEGSKASKLESQRKDLERAIKKSS